MRRIKRYSRFTAKKYFPIGLVALVVLVLLSSTLLFGCTQEQPTTGGGTGGATDTESADSQPAASGDEPIELQIFAPESLSKALDEVQQLYVQEHDRVGFKDTQYLASGEIVEEMEAGTTADLLITASKDSMDEIESMKLIDLATRFDLFSNDLLIVAKKSVELSEVTLQDIANGEYTFAVGDDSVSAGNYAAQALSTVGAYEDSSGAVGAEAAGKGGSYVNIVPTFGSSVDELCKKVEAGDVELAVVYASDVYRFDDIEVVGEIPADTHKTITYPVAACVDSEVSQEAADFLDWAGTNAEALAVWEKWGLELC